MAKFGGDTGVDADYLADGDYFVCQGCDDDIERGEEVEIDHLLYCEECGHKLRAEQAENRLQEIANAREELLFDLQSDAETDILLKGKPITKENIRKALITILFRGKHNA